jgi:DNA-binding NarL/FixJ family response regulator
MPVRGVARVSRLGRPLTNREREVLALMVQDLPYKVIAERLGVGFKCVDKYACQVHQKLGAHSVLGVVRVALRQGLISTEDLLR